MSRAKLKLHQTDMEVLISNLRGEIGEIITSWTLLRMFMVEASRERSSNLEADFRNRRLIGTEILIDKLTDEIVARLSELAEEKVGCLNFYFAVEKLQSFRIEAGAFTKFIRQNRFKEKRDRDISHKEAPQSWTEDRYLRISYQLVLKAIARALRLMKKLDRKVLGPCAPYLWRKVRGHRYKPIAPPRAGYAMLLYYFLTPAEREAIIVQEIAEGLAEWELIDTNIDGADVKIFAYRKWSALILGGRLLVLEVYPLSELDSLKTNVPPEEPSGPVECAPNQAARSDG